MRKSFWLFAIVLSMSLGIRAQAAPREIPDHFNTGVDTDTELTEIPEPGIYGGIQYKTGAGGQLALDLVYSNRQAGNEIEIRNMDFSRYALLMVNEGKIAVETTVTFRNCKFDAVTTGGRMPGYPMCSKTAPCVIFREAMPRLPGAVWVAAAEMR